MTTIFVVISYSIFFNKLNLLYCCYTVHDVDSLHIVCFINVVCYLLIIIII